MRETDHDGHVKDDRVDDQGDGHDKDRQIRSPDAGEELIMMVILMMVKVMVMVMLMVMLMMVMVMIKVSGRQMRERN